MRNGGDRIASQHPTTGRDAIASITHAWQILIPMLIIRRAIWNLECGRTWGASGSPTCAYSCPKFLEAFNAIHYKCKPSDQEQLLNDLEIPRNLEL